jgi:hypothetical protein
MKKIGLVLLVAIFGWFWFTRSQETDNYDAFAQCLTESGAKEYGAFWCPHCSDQKKMFGSSWEYVTYIECSNPDKTQNQTCQEAGIESYPTWEFGDGSRVSGLLSFEQLAEKTACLLE